MINDIQQRVNHIREWQQNNGLDALIIPHDDEYLSEQILDEVNKDLSEGGLISEKVDSNTLKSKIYEITPLIKERLKTLDESSHLVEYFFYENFEIDKEKLVPKKTEKSEIIIGLKKSIELIEKTKLFEPENLEIEFRALAEELGLKAGQLFFPIRIALTGRRESPPLFDTMKAIGTESSIKRLNNAINILE